MDYPPGFGPEAKWDFEGEVRWLAPEEGGRSNPVLWGYRPSINFPLYDQQEGDWMIFPIHFCGPSGENLNPQEPLPERVIARFSALNRPQFENLHKIRLEVGHPFFVREGSRNVGEGVITKVNW
jgi:translation elongation factor EF-Tu-like GTPase